MSVEPIRPEQIPDSKKRSMPDTVLEVFNALLVEKYSNGQAKLAQPEIMIRLIDRGYSRSEIFGNGWLDVEDIYRAAGWKVEYDKAGYDSRYEAFFRFERIGPRGGT